MSRDCPIAAGLVSRYRYAKKILVSRYGYAKGFSVPLRKSSVPFGEHRLFLWITAETRIRQGFAGNLAYF